MFCIGEVSIKVKKLVHVTKECVLLGLQEVKPWGFLGDVAEAIHSYANSCGYSVVSEYWWPMALALLFMKNLGKLCS